MGTGDCTATIDAAVVALESTVAGLRAHGRGTGVAAPADGRYTGADVDVTVEVRVDRAGSGVLSGDVHRARDGGHLASFRTAPGRRYDGADRAWAALWQDGTGRTATGTLRASASVGSSDAFLLTFRLDGPVSGLAAHRDRVIIVHREGDELRHLGLEIETEQGVAPPAPVVVGGVAMTVQEALRRAGFAVHDVGAPTAVPARAGGWNLSVAFTVLHDLMTASAQAPMTAPAWELHLLMLGTSTRERLAGVMFDDGDALPRQGAAVFVDTIRGLVPPAEQDRKIIQTTVHELGHALNLAHRFERGVGRADSTSFMNYDRHHPGGAAEFWRRFAFTFDPDELEFLRHGPRAAVVPGGSGFRTVSYWADGTGGHVPYYPQVPVPGFTLTLHPPAAGPVLAFGQPVFLEVTLENRTAEAVELPPETLDPKAGFLELLVRRVTGRNGPPLAGAVPFVPIMQRCFEEDPAAAEVLAPGGVLRNNLNLTYGSGGFAFAEPGEYGVTPFLGFVVRGAGGRPEELVIRGAELRIRVAHPRDDGAERDALTLLRPDVGAWFALGGSDCLAAAGSDLEEVRARRTAERGERDAVVAAIVRAAGIAAGRPSLRFAGGRFVAGPPDEDRAAKLLGGLDDAALRAFDRHTAEHTRALAGRYRDASG